MEKIYKVLPKYAVIPILSSLILNCLVYWGSRIITGNMYHYDLSIGIDRMLPFVPEMIVPYVLAYVAWIIGFIVIGRESREVCYEVMTGEQIAKIICLVCFIVMPTTITRPEITGSGISSTLSQLIYNADSPDNLFPSIHCLESWLCFRGSIRCKKVGKCYRIVMFIAAILVFASTVLVKQHVFIDIIGGIAVVEIGLLLSGKLKLYKGYFLIEKKLEKNEE